MVGGNDGMNGVQFTIATEVLLDFSFCSLDFGRQRFRRSRKPRKEATRLWRSIQGKNFRGEDRPPLVSGSGVEKVKAGSPTSRQKT